MIVHNPADVPVLDYPIEEPGTKNVQLWSIKPGETLEFPDHVGAYLIEVYGFLQRVMTEAERKQELAEAEKLRTGKHFTQVKIVESKPKEVEQPETLGGFTNAAIGGSNVIESSTAPEAAQPSKKK